MSLPRLFLIFAAALLLCIIAIQRHLPRVDLFHVKSEEEKTLRKSLYFSEIYIGFFEVTIKGLFQVVSFATTTGFTTADFNAWPLFLPYVLLYAAIIGACAGSTGGGMKVIRILLIFLIYFWYWGYHFYFLKIMFLKIFLGRAVT